MSDDLLTELLFGDILDTAPILDDIFDEDGNIDPDAVDLLGWPLRPSPPPEWQRPLLEQIQAMRADLVRVSVPIPSKPGEMQWTAVESTVSEQVMACERCLSLLADRDDVATRYLMTREVEHLVVVVRRFASKQDEVVRVCTALVADPDLIDNCRKDLQREFECTETTLKRAIRRARAILKF